MSAAQLVVYLLVALLAGLLAERLVGASLPGGFFGAILAALLACGSWSASCTSPCRATSTWPACRADRDTRRRAGPRRLGTAIAGTVAGAPPPLARLIGPSTVRSGGRGRANHDRTRDEKAGPRPLGMRRRREAARSASATGAAQADDRRRPPLDGRLARAALSNLRRIEHEVWGRAHAGTTPMDLRRDAMTAAADMILRASRCYCAPAWSVKTRFSPLGWIIV